MAYAMDYPDENIYYDEEYGAYVPKQVLDQLMVIFPDADVEYLKRICMEYASSDVEDLIEILCADGYDKKFFDHTDALEKLKEIFPDADPDYLHQRSIEFKSTEDVSVFVTANLDKPSFPSIVEYNKRMDKAAEITKMGTEFNVQEFLKKFPKPQEYFSDPNRPRALCTADPNFAQDKLYALGFLNTRYPLLRASVIKMMFERQHYDLIRTSDLLDTMPNMFLKPRSRPPKSTLTENLNLLHEIAYIKHRNDIRILFKLTNESYLRAKEQAAKRNLLRTCQCCFDEELIPEECYFCKNICVFCKNCIKKGAEVNIGNGKLEFPCLAGCGGEFSFSTLQMVLDSVTFARLAQKKQIEEVKSANIDGLEMCPFCEYATIPPPEDKIFRCQNKECMKESCRKCWHASHIPLKCNEIEYDEDVKMRTYIENKMTEALIRKCWKCKKVFVKESGCNKMVCYCGAQMCYVCRKPVQDYHHFSESNDGRCPLWTKDLKRFHQNQVRLGAQVAKTELGVDAAPGKLKIDPTQDLEQHVI